MADKLSNQQIDNLITDAVDAILEDNTMDTKKINDASLGKLVDTARHLHALSEDYPGAQSMQHRAIEIKQTFREQTKKRHPSRVEKKNLLPFIPRPLTAFSMLSALVIVLAVVTVALQGTVGSTTASAIGGTWGIPALIGGLIAAAGIAYWLSKKQ